MCFSAPASFSAGTILTVVGVLTLGKTKDRREILLASVPLLFAAQQFTEGFLWLALLQGKSVMWQYWLTRLYAIFVGIVWPLVIPASIFLIEPDRLKKRLILLLMAVGAGVAAYTLKVVAGAELNAVIVNRCIQYEGVEWAGNLLLMTYILSTSAAFFCSSYRSINLIGMMNIGTFFVAYYSYEINFASGWCFLAAVVSGFIYLHFRHAVRMPVVAISLSHL